MLDDPADSNGPNSDLKKRVARLEIAADRGGESDHLGSGAFSLQIGDSSDAPGDRSTALGPGAQAPGENGTAVGHTTYAGAADSAAFGNDAFVDDAHTRGFAIGADAVTLAADEGAIGASYHTVGIPGKLRIASNPPASSAATGTQGEVSWDSSYWYVCVSANSWKRIALSTF